mgnify:CR=1 FL=1
MEPKKYFILLGGIPPAMLFLSNSFLTKSILIRLQFSGRHCEQEVAVETPGNKISQLVFHHFSLLTYRGSQVAGLGRGLGKSSRFMKHYCPTDISRAWLM